MKVRGATLLSFIVILTLIVPAQPAPALPSTFVELDNNVRHNGAGTFDWANAGSSPTDACTVTAGVVSCSGAGGLYDGGTFVNATTTPTAPTATAAATADATILDKEFLVDPMSSDATTAKSGPPLNCGPGDFTTYTGAGGETNNEQFSTMTFGTSSVPPKDEISNVYAIAHRRADTKTEIFFGAERVDNNGASHIDMEFLQASVTIPNACSGSFSGHRTQGDLLLVIDFGQGGAIATPPKLYKWTCATVVPDGTVCDPTGHGKGQPEYVLTSSSAVTFGVNSAGSVRCGGWACRTTTGARSDNLELNALLEGGLVLEDAGFNGCISTFLPHTRSSPSVTASLKDFGGPVDFDSCETPTVATTSSPTGGSQVPGVSASDSVTVSGGGATPTGTVDFYLCGPSTSDAATGCPTGGSLISNDVPLVSGSATSSSTTATTAIGLYCWRAEFTPAAGTQYNSASHTNATTECFTVVKQNPTIVTTSSPTGGGQVPDVVASDSATVSGGFGTPTGTVDFYLCGPTEVDGTGCPTGGTLIADDAALDGSGIATSGTTADALYSTHAVGTYCWRAEYSGDDTYNGASHTNATTECFTVVKQSPSIVTTSSPTGGDQVPDVVASDSATVSGDYGIPTGTVDFYLCGPTEVDATGCPTGGTLISDDVSLNGSGEASSVSTSTAGYSTHATGSYCWRVEYSGDAIYNSGSHTNDGTECFAVVQQTPTIVTTSSPTGGDQAPDVVASDSATVSGDYGIPTGTVDFYLCGPTEVDGTGCPTGGTLIADDAALDGSGLANSGSTTDAGYSTHAVGTYCWRAEYSGDATYVTGNHTNATTECFTVVKQAPTVATTSSPTGGNQVPDVVASDSATVSGDYGIPTGTVDFYLCGPTEVDGTGCPTGGTLIADDAALDGTGVATSGTTADALYSTHAVGTYCWRAEYSGDDIYNGASHTNATTECFTVVKQASTVVTTSTPTGGDQAPDVVASDSATVSGDYGVPTGTVDFYLCGPTEVDGTGCPTGGTLIADDAALDGSGVATSGSTTDAGYSTHAVGTYCWRAEYSGDDTYDGSSHTNATTECFTVTKRAPVTSTGSSPQGSNEVPDVAATDTATVSGSFGTPTGTVTFFLCAPADVTAGGCEGTAGTQIGSAVALLETAPGTAQATSTDTATASFSTHAVGKYCWRAEYSGDDTYLTDTHTNTTTECFTVVKQPSTVVTTSSPTGGNQVPDVVASDSATVSGDYGVPTGTMDFYLCGPTEVDGTGCPTGGTLIADDAALDGSGIATSGSTTDAGYSTHAVGTYCWRAEYSGDDTYDGSSHTNATTECFTVVKQPSTVVTTSTPTGGNQAPDVVASDSATVSGDYGIPTGTVDFYLCGPTEVDGTGCPTGGTLIADDAALNGSGIATSGSTTDAGYSTHAVGTYCWRAEYSGDDTYDGSSHTNATTECFTVTQRSPVTTTASSPQGTTEAPDVSATDTATVSGSFGTPTGTVTFFLCAPADVTAGGCEGTAGTQIGSAVALLETAPGTAQATSTDTATASFSTHAVGKYCWRAEYSGDATYFADTHTNTTTECFTVVQQTPTIVTASTPNGSAEVPGVSASDEATVSGDSGVPTGTVAFYLCGPGVSDPATGCPTGGTLITAAAPLSGGIANSDSTTATTTPGLYCWRAEYSGDATYVGGSHTNATTECFTVSIPGIRGKTVGFWRNQNGNAILSDNGGPNIHFTDVNGNPVTSVTIGLQTPSGLRYATVTTLAQSNKILGGGACDSTTNFNIGCDSRTQGLKIGTLNNLAAQTLAFTYNTLAITGFAGQTLADLGCTAPTTLSTASLPTALDPGVSSTSTLLEALDLANRLVGYSVYGGHTTQTRAGAANSLLGGCVNVEA